MKQPKGNDIQLAKQVKTLQQLVNQLRRQGIEATVVKKATFSTCN